MKQPITAILLLALLLSACTRSQSLWGTYNTPTPLPPPATPTQPSPTPTPTATATATPTPTATATAPQMPGSTGERTPYLYNAQSGDWLPGLANRFGVSPESIQSVEPLSPTGLIPPDTLLVIPNVLDDLTASVRILPDSEMVYSGSATGFITADYVREAGGYLGAGYREYLTSTAWTSGPEAIQRIAVENSINPRLLLALVEHQAKWVRGNPTNLSQSDYPLGYQNYHYRGLFRQLMWAAQELMVGYYGWRSGDLTTLTFKDGSSKRLSPELNAGSVAVMYFFSHLYNQAEWAQIVDPHIGFTALYTEMFGDPWSRAEAVEPLFPAGATQPLLILPFMPEQVWAYTGGPHAAWERDGAMAAIDFAPGSDIRGCSPAEQWVVASAAGLVVRSETGVVVIDLDGDGSEQTGWNLLYLHLASAGRAPLGAWVEAGDPLGHPSCEGGISTGRHVHFVRKYNGEWVLAGGPLPFTLSGWVVQNGATPYEGLLVRGEQVITANRYGTFESRIVRGEGE